MMIDALALIDHHETISWLFHIMVHGTMDHVSPAAAPTSKAAALGVGDAWAKNAAVVTTL